MGAISKSEEGGEGAVVWPSLPAGQQDFLVWGVRPSRVQGVPLVFSASLVAAAPGWRVESRQGCELGQMALIEQIGRAHV